MPTRKNGRWTAFADARGIDAKYAQVRAQAEKELAETGTEPHTSISTVPPGDTEMKNPHGEFQHPSPMVGASHHAGMAREGADGSKEDGTTDLQGQQGRAGTGRG